MQVFTVIRLGSVKVSSVRSRKRLGRDWQRWEARYGSCVVHLFGRRGWGISCWSVTKGCTSRFGWADATCYEEVNDVKKKVRAESTSEHQHLAAVESDLLSKHQSLVQHCCVTRYDDGDSRQPGWFTIKTMGSAWVVEIKDPDTCSRLVVVQQTLDDAITLAALLLEAEEAPWEADPWLTAAKAKKKR